MVILTRVNPPLSALPAYRADRTAYTIGGECYPRVTAICGLLRKPQIERWRGRVGNREADRASARGAALGSHVHAAANHLATAMIQKSDIDAHAWLSDQSDELRPFIAAFVGWLTTEQCRVIASERLVVSHRYRYAGTMDLLVQLRDGRFAIVDLKTGRIVPREARLQTAAYVLALYEQDRAFADGRIVLHLPSYQPGLLRQSEYQDLKGDFIAVHRLRELYDWHGASTNAEVS